MMHNQNIQDSNMQNKLINISKLHMVLSAVYATYIILSDATNLITPTAVLKRWEFNAALLIMATMVWYLAKNNHKSSSYYIKLVYALIVMDIAFASFNVYSQRGMASRAVIFFVLPIIVSTILLKKRAVMLTATLCAVFYVLSAVKYFVDNFNEGYKAELYIEVGLYCALFYLIAKCLIIIANLVEHKTS